LSTGTDARRLRLLDLLGPSGPGAIAVSHLPNIRYLTGFTGSNALLLLTRHSAALFTDPRYELQAGQECDCPVRVVRGQLWPELVKEARRRRVRRLAVEAAYLTVEQWNRLDSLRGRSLRLDAASGYVERLRTVKSPEEIQAIRSSVALCSKAYTAVVRRIRSGMTEQHIAALLDHQMRLLGAEGPAFETIVAAGPRSALPHARPTARPVRRNQLVLIDMGASLSGYASDMTRVVHIGRPGAKARRLYDAVLEAQLAALAAVAPGVKSSAVDDAARKSLKRNGLDKAFQHSTGHGLGLEIHEGPRLGAGVDDRLEAGMVITIEPGAYLEGFGGVRIEDTVLVTSGGAEILTPAKKELLVVEA
jgi:Xaa-Pro aminopeptidase